VFLNFILYPLFVERLSDALLTAARIGMSKSRRSRRALLRGVIPKRQNSMLTAMLEYVTGDSKAFFPPLCGHFIAPLAASESGNFYG
jgi:hypothetical protein